MIGINLDSLSQDATGKKADPKEVVSTVRWFLLHHRAAWPNLIGAGAEAAAKAYGVNEVPANFLVGRDGSIVQVERQWPGPHKRRRASRERPGRRRPALTRIGMVALLLVVGQCHSPARLLSTCSRLARNLRSFLASSRSVRTSCSSAGLP